MSFPNKPISTEARRQLSLVLVLGKWEENNNGYIAMFTTASNNYNVSNEFKHSLEN